MYLVLLKFSASKANAGTFMEGHKAWLKQGFDDGVFLVAGSLVPGLGGAILAHGTTPEALARRVDGDPFVAEGVVTAEIHQVAPALTDARLDFLRT